jgi:hypothetical protein
MISAGNLNVVVLVVEISDYFSLLKKVCVWYRVNRFGEMTRNESTRTIDLPLAPQRQSCSLVLL